MSINFNRPIVFFVLETTGTKVDSDRIVQISQLKYNPEFFSSYKVFLPYSVIYILKVFI